MHFIFVGVTEQGPIYMWVHTQLSVYIQIHPQKHDFQFSSVQSLSRVRLFATPWIAALQAPLSITISRSSFRLTSIESVMPSSHLILCRALLLLPPIPPSIRVFSNESTLHMRCQSTGVSASASFLPRNTQGWAPLEWTGWISQLMETQMNFWANPLFGMHGL